MGGYYQEAREISGWLAGAVGVSSRSEFLDSSVWSNVFNSVTKGRFVEQGLTTTARLLFTTFRLHQVITQMNSIISAPDPSLSNTSMNQNSKKETRNGIRYGWRGNLEGLASQK